jgi:hypothetical protein
MAGHRFWGWRFMRAALSTDVDHDNNVLTSQGEYQPIERCRAGDGSLPLPARAGLGPSPGMSLVVAIPIPQPG